MVETYLLLNFQPFYLSLMKIIAFCRLKYQFSFHFGK